jgi:RimJ/RimL family protein N-acetyltransferase
MMELDTLVAVIDPPNAASRSVVEKLGLQFECIKSVRDPLAHRDDVSIAYFHVRF